MGLEYILALTLIQSPMAPSNEYLKSIDFRTMAPVIQHVAIAKELMDDREKNYVLSRSSDFRLDIDLIRTRYQKLQEAPPWHDCMRFPHRKVISSMLEFNREYRKLLKEKWAIEPYNRSIYAKAIEETDYLYQFWDAVRDAQSEYYYVTLRRLALKKVIKMIGEENFYNGNFPPHVPVWRFRLID